MIESIMRNELINDPKFVSKLTRRIMADRSEVDDVDMPLRVVDIRAFRSGCTCSECELGVIGEIDVQYSTLGWQAVYGFTAAGIVTCYMD